MPDQKDLMQYAWKRRFDEVPPDAPKAMKITPKLIFEMLPTVVRIKKLDGQLKKQGKEPFFDAVMGTPIEPVHGVPLGGMGGGSITRGWKGDFTRWQMRPGVYHYGTVDADQFSVRVQRKGEKPQAIVLNASKPKTDYLQSWNWGLDPQKATYHALFPQAWTVYESPVDGIRLTCKQVSPFIPGNYQESSYPVAVFSWQIENTAKNDADVSLMFTFQNGIGTPNDLIGGYANHLVRQPVKNGEITEIDMAHIIRMPKPLDPGQALKYQSRFEDALTLAIGALGSKDVEVTYRTRFVTTSHGLDVWGDFESDGRLDNDADAKPSPAGTTIGSALCAKVHLKPGETQEVLFSLAWDMPLARFSAGTGWYRRYTKFMGRDGKAAPKLIKAGLTEYTDWEKAIEKWQKPVLSDKKLSDWYKSMLFNETYYLVDGGTLWTAGKENDVPTSGDLLPEPEIGHFGYLESHDYRMINTYDVHFYASFALARLFPELELSLQRDFANSIFVEHPERLQFFMSGMHGIRKVRGAVPHDLGAPNDDPWVMVNAYNAQDVSRWKDLNPKFVLQVMRSYAMTRDIRFLKAVWPAVKEAIHFEEKFDRDGDGMIENDGFPDQTYDVWSVKGVSAYSGGLWLACLKAGAAMAERLGEVDLAAQYLATFEKGSKVYEDTLWNGEYYAYDASGSKHSDSIMADQLAGHWYALASGLGGIVAPERAALALKKVYDVNVMGYKAGSLGAMNGMRPDGTLDRTCLQSTEIWTGTTFAVAAAMIQAGLADEGFKTAEGIYNMLYQRFGLWFNTPEALSYEDAARATSYMRPLCIWAIQDAWEKRYK